MGTYQPMVGSSQCLVCPGGFACAGNESLPIPCARFHSIIMSIILFGHSVFSSGHYCPNGTLHPNQHPCPLSTFSDQQMLASSDECSLCPSGFYCNQTGVLDFLLFDWFPQNSRVL